MSSPDGRWSLLFPGSAAVLSQVRSQADSQDSSMPSSPLDRASKLDIVLDGCQADIRFELSQIAWWLLEVYFGLDASGFESARKLADSWCAHSLMADIVHPFLGPLLIITYALLSNTLLLTVLVAILGNTFATINADAAAEVSCLATIPRVELISSQCFEKPYRLLKGSKPVRSSCQVQPRIPADMYRCGLQLPAPIQPGCRCVYVANELYP
jgi:hypothetical protein